MDVNGKRSGFTLIEVTVAETALFLPRPCWLVMVTGKLGGHEQSHPQDGLHATPLASSVRHFLHEKPSIKPVSPTH
jgi:hypothetical protein